MAVVVYPVNRSQRVIGVGKGSHIIVEGLKTMEPFFINPDSSPAIVGIGFAIGVGTPGKDTCPDAKKPRVGHAVRLAPLNRIVHRQTATGLAYSFAEVIAEDDVLNAAIALAEPERLVVLAPSGMGNDCPASEALTEQVDGSGGEWGMIRHADFLLTGIGHPRSVCRAAWELLLVNFYCSTPVLFTKGVRYGR